MNRTMISRILRHLAVPVLLVSALAAQAQEPAEITVTSTAFDHHGMVPLRHTAYGDNVSPRIAWSDLPDGTRQLALVMDDPVAPTPEPFVHWVVYNIPASASALPEGMSSDQRIEAPAELAGATNGRNGLGRVGHFGPRPPADGELHAYHYRVYALDSALELEPGLGKDELLAAIDGHVIGTGMLMGHYERTE